jgi:putative hemolysin
VKLATSLAELDAAQRLRFEVFNLELQEGLLASYERGRDTDAYDAYCDHLIATDLTTGAVVGTYRLLRRSVAARHIGFYSENEFDLSNLKQQAGEWLELGRSCVARSHRTAGVIALLWAAIIEYAALYDVQQMFGCGSLHTAEPAVVQKLFAYLRDYHYAPAELRVWPLSTCRLEIGAQERVDYDAKAVMRQLPPIMKGYLRAGAVIAGPPALDREFGTADVLVLLPLAKLTARYRRRFVEAEGIGGLA